MNPKQAPNMRPRFDATLQDFESSFEEERKKAPRLAKAWKKAENRYESQLKDEGSEARRAVVMSLVDGLPDELKEKPDYLIKAAMVCNMKGIGFLEVFNKQTKGMLNGSENSWEKYKFKCFFILMFFAAKQLPRVVDEEKEKNVFAKVEGSPDIKVGDTFGFEDFATFTGRKMALGEKEVNLLHHVISAI